MALISVPSAWNTHFDTRFHRLGRLSKEMISTSIICTLAILAGVRLILRANPLGPWLVLGSSVVMAVLSSILSYLFIRTLIPIAQFFHASLTLDYLRCSVEIVPFLVIAWFYRKGK